VVAAAALGGEEEEEEPAVALIESDICAQYIAERWAARGTALLPRGAAARARMRLFVGVFMESLAPCMLGMISVPRDEEGVERELHKLLGGLRAVELCLAKHGGGGGDGHFFFGAQYSLAEALTAPFVVRMQAQLATHRGLDIGGGNAGGKGEGAAAATSALPLCAALQLPRLQRWWAAVHARPSTVRTTPAPASLRTLAPYVRPTFYPSLVGAAAQRAACEAALASWAPQATAANLAEEREFEKLLAAGNRLHAEEKRAKQSDKDDGHAGEQPSLPPPRPKL
jgi:glutathione S-transferase